MNASKMPVADPESSLRLSSGDQWETRSHAGRLPWKTACYRTEGKIPEAPPLSSGVRRLPGARALRRVDPGEEVNNAQWCPSDERFRTVVLEGASNISVSRQLQDRMRARR